MIEPRMVVDMKMIYSAPLSNLVDNSASRLRHPSFIGRLQRRDDLRAELESAPANPSSLSERRRLNALSDEKKRIDFELGKIKDEHVAVFCPMYPDPPEHELDVPEGAFVVGSYPSGSAEWLRQRQPTLGGSDVGAIVKADPVWGKNNYTRVRESKLDQNPQTQDHSGAAGRGDAWEPALVSILSDILETPVYTNKETVSNGKRHANLDGFIVGDDGKVSSIVECKTSSFPNEWSENHIPVGYGLQVQHYMDFYSVDSAYLIVNIDDNVIKVYKISSDDEFQTFDSNGDAVGLFRYSDVVEYADRMVEKWNAERANPRPSVRRRSKWSTVRGSWELALTNGMVFLDLETSTLSPKTGHIIEIGAIRDDGKEFSEFFGVPDDHAAWNGTGAVDVHRITLEDVEGKPVLLYSDEWIQRLRDFVGDRVVIAHNASFEKRWLDYLGTHFNYADTMFAFSALVDDAPDNTMKSLTEAAGMEYVDAHRAINDTRMMKDAYDRFLGPLVERNV